MTRTELAPNLNQRHTYQGRVERFGTKPAYRGPPQTTVLLVEVCDAAGRQVTDHLWLTVGKRLAALQLQPGDLVQFDARVTTYTKGYKGRREGGKPLSRDYRLSYPTNLRKVPATAATQAPLPLEPPPAPPPPPRQPRPARPPAPPARRRREE
jgi:hypothetical protein